MFRISSDGLSRILSGSSAVKTEGPVCNTLRGAGGRRQPLRPGISPDSALYGSTERCAPGCSLKEALGDLGLTGGSLGASFLHSDKGHAPGTNDAGRAIRLVRSASRLYDDDVDRARFHEIVSEAFKVPYCHVQPCYCVQFRPETRFPVRIWSLVKRTGRQDVSGVHTEELKTRWSGQVNAIFERYASRKTLSRKCFCDAMASLGFSEELQYAEILSTPEERIDLESFKVVVQCFALQVYMRTSFAMLQLSSSQDPHATVESIAASMPEGWQRKIGLQKFWELSTKGESEASADTVFESFRAVTSLGILEQDSSLFEIIENRDLPFSPVEPTTEIVLEEHALLEDYLGAMQARTSWVENGCVPADFPAPLRQLLSLIGPLCCSEAALERIVVRCFCLLIAPNKGSSAKSQSNEDETKDGRDESKAARCAVLRALEGLSDSSYYGLIPWLELLCALSRHGQEDAMEGTLVQNLCWDAILAGAQVQKPIRLSP